jgi:hypothetical protein
LSWNSWGETAARTERAAEPLGRSRALTALLGRAQTATANDAAAAMKKRVAMRADLLQRLPVGRGIQILPIEKAAAVEARLYTSKG